MRRPLAPSLLLALCLLSPLATLGQAPADAGAAPADAGAVPGGPAALAPVQRGFRFAWPVPSRVRVTEKSLQKGLRSTLRYDAVLTARPDGTLALDVENAEFLELDGVDVSGGKPHPERKVMEAYTAAAPVLVLSPEGRLLGMEGVEAETERVIKAMRLSPRQRQQALAMARQPTLQVQRRIKVMDTWMAWVGAWQGLELVRGERRDIAYNPGGTGTVSHLGGYSTHPGAVRLQLHTTLEGPQYESAIQAILDGLHADLKRTQGKRQRLREPKLLSAHKVLRVEVLTDPGTLRPHTLREETYQEMHVEGEAPFVEKRTVDTTFEWLEPAAR